jgi:biotin synthase
VRRTTGATACGCTSCSTRRAGLCPEDCGYCSQSKISGAEIDKYPMLARERILEAADRAAALNAGTFCMVISGRSPGGRVFERVLDAVREVKRGTTSRCAPASAC